MKYFKSALQIILLTLVVITWSYAEDHALMQNKKSSSANDDIGWVKQDNEYNLCGGYYKELPILYIPNLASASQSDNYDINADQSLYSIKGVSTLKGNVKITQQNAELTADTAYIYRDETGRLSSAKSFGHVKFREPNRLILANYGQLDFTNKIITLYDIRYRAALNQSKTQVVKNPKTGKFETRLYQLNAWGTANKAKRLKHDEVELRDATYTTCPPDQNCWKLKASTIRLNSDTGRGTAYNTRVLVSNFPIFYSPYFNFPIDKRRKTGFLLPSMGTSSNNGVTIQMPYYLNLAPNYDATITPEYMYKRGVLWNGFLRYLTEKNRGSFGGSYIFSDRAFKTFQKNAKNTWSNSPTYHDLLRENDNRSSYYWRDHTNFNDHWNSDVDYNFVSDDYIIQDFGDNMIDNSENQILRQGTLNYIGQYWSMLGNLQYYQTLHPVNQDNVQNQYARLPQLQFNGNFPDQWLGLDYTTNMEYVRFWEGQNPWENFKPVVGNRMDFRPTVDMPLLWPFAYVIPRAQVQLTKYDLGHAGAKQPNRPGIGIPIFDVNAGMYFDRQFTLFKYLYRQTLEPVLYYLYVPYRNQNRFPYFDTNVQSFTYDSMFQDNRFSGIDRIGDANQITLGVTTRFIDDNTGEQKASASIGQIHYFRNREVGLCYNADDSQCTMSSIDRRPVSPIAGALTYNFNAWWSAFANATWNTQRNAFDNDNVGVQFKPNDYHIINVGYDYVRGGDVLVGAPAGSPNNDLKQTDINGYWKLTNHWSFMGRWNYNWSHEHAQAYFGGVAYESCCWAIRAVVARTFISTGPGPRYLNTYDNSIYIQFALKGLGNVGGQPSSLLLTGINGYTDNFGKDN